MAYYHTPVASAKTALVIHSRAVKRDFPPPFCKRLAGLVFVLMGLLVASCENASQENLPGDTITAHPGGLTFALPGPIASVRMITVDQLRVEATIGGTDIVVARRDGAGGRITFQSEPFVLPGPGAHALEIRWFDMSNEDDLLLADFGPLMLDDSSSRTVAITESDYDYQHDADNDGTNNIAEVRNGSDPFDAMSPGQPDDDNRVNVLVSAPADILAAPFVVPAQLEADIIFFGTNEITFRQPLARSGDMWSGRFEPRADDERFSIFWYERIGTQRVVLGAYRLQDTSGELSGRTVQDEDLRFSRTTIDADGDGRDNLRERATGSDPNVSDDPPPYSASQTACATPTFVAEASGDNLIQTSAFPAPLRIQRGFSDGVSIEDLAGSRFLRSLFAVADSGTLRIQHLAGPPNDSVIEIWERQLDGTLRLMVRADDPMAGVTRALLETELTSGGFCFLMSRFREDAAGVDFNGPLQPFGESDDGVATVDLMIEYQ